MEGVAFFGYVFTRPRGQKACWLIKANLGPSLTNKSCFLRQPIQRGSTGNHPVRVWIYLKRLSCATRRASRTDGCTLWESQWPSPRQLSGNAKGPGMSWLKQTIFKRLKVMWGVYFSGIVGADRKYWCLSSNGSAGKKKMWLLCVSLHPFLFKYVVFPSAR